MLLLVTAAVGGGVAMVVIAGGDGAADTVSTEVRRTAQVQTADLSPDARARTLGLTAVLRIDPERRQVQVLPVTGDFDRSAPLELALRHPARADADLRLALAPDALGWQADALPASTHHWRVELVPPDGGWRLQGRLEKGAHAAHLQSALAGG
jgi:hypothetical protein